MNVLTPMESIPLSTDADGAIRVSQTRVTLDTIVAAFIDGATPEEIAQQYPSVPLADVYSVVGYYLHHRADVDSYLACRSQQAQAIRIANEKRFDAAGVRQRLLARRSNGKP